MCHTIFCCRDITGGKKYVGTERIPGKTVVITGATSGIGKATAQELANRGVIFIILLFAIFRPYLGFKKYFTLLANNSIHCFETIGCGCVIPQILQCCWKLVVQTHPVCC